MRDNLADWPCDGLLRNFKHTRLKISIDFPFFLKTRELSVGIFSFEQQSLLMGILYIEYESLK